MPSGEVTPTATSRRTLPLMTSAALQVSAPPRVSDVCSCCCYCCSCVAVVVVVVVVDVVAAAAVVVDDDVVLFVLES